MQWNKDILKQARVASKLSQLSLAQALGVHFRTVQNWEKGVTAIPTSTFPALDQIICKNDVVPREEYDKVVEALNSATDLNRKLSNLLQSNRQTTLTTESNNE